MSVMPSFSAQVCCTIISKDTNPVHATTTVRKSSDKASLQNRPVACSKALTCSCLISRRLNKNLEIRATGLYLQSRLPLHLSTDLALVVPNRSHGGWNCKSENDRSNTIAVCVSPLIYCNYGINTGYIHCH